MQGIKYIKAAELSSNLSGFLILDVRTSMEFKEGHIEGALNIPLGELNGKEDVLKNAQKIAVICKGGVRACKACDLLPLTIKEKAVVLEGGMDAWQAAGFSSASSGARVKFGVINQMQMVIGVMLVAFALLAIFVNKWFVLGPLFMGVMLFFAGLTGFCLLVTILSKMPWNR